MQITFTCPSCETSLEVESENIGKDVGCPSCGTAIAVPRQEPGPGTTIGGFFIKSLIGKGGMGNVFLATQLSMDRDVALKVLSAAVTKDPEDLERFMNEVRMTAKLEHPNIVSAYEAGEDDGFYYMAMAYINGLPLDKKIQSSNNHRLEEKEALRITKKIATALSYACDEHGMLHRDIKPENILMDSHGEPKLADLGLSKAHTQNRKVTTDGTIMGTPNYMSPEQMDNLANADARSDIYSLGASLYQMLTGIIPFESDSIVKTFKLIATETLCTPKKYNPKISLQCITLLERMLSRSPESRYQNWKEVLNDINRALSNKPILTPRLAAGESILDAPAVVADNKSIPQKRKKGKSGKKIVFSLAAIAIILIALFFMLSTKEGDKQQQQPTPVSKSTSQNIVHTSAKKDLPQTIKHSTYTPKQTPSPQIIDSTISSVLPSLADALIEMDFISATALIKETDSLSLSAGDADQWKKIRANATEAINSQKLVLSSFGNDKGKITTVFIKNGTSQKIRVLSISGNTISAVSASTGKKYSLTIKDIHEKEYFRRLGTKKSSGLNIMRGILSYNAHSHDSSQKYFLSANCELANVILEKTKTLATEQQSLQQKKNDDILEAKAKSDYYKILQLLKLTHTLNNTDKTIESLEVNKYGQLTLQRLLKMTKSYKVKYKSTTYFSNHADVIEAIEALDKDSSKSAENYDIDSAIHKLMNENPEMRSKPIVSTKNNTLKIFIDDSGISNLNALKGLPINSLTVLNGKISSLRPLKGMPLSYLRLANCPNVNDISPLKGAPLKHLIISVSSISNLSPLKGMALSYLKLNFNRSISNISVLKNMPLTSLSLRSTSVSRLKPLEGMQLTSLDISDTKVTSVKPLKNMPLRKLSVIKTNINDLSSLKHISGLVIIE